MKHLKRYQTGGPIQEPTGGECPQSTTNPQMNATNESVAIQDADIAYNPSGGETGNPCAGCAVFDVSTRIQGCMQEGGETKGYCWINQFECESAGTCNKFEAGGPIVDDEISYDMQGRYNNEPPPPQQQEQQMAPPGMAPPGIEAPQMGPQMGAPAYAFGGEVLKHGGEPCHGWGKVRGRKYLPRAEYGRFTTPNVDYGRNNLAPDYSTAPWLNTNPYLAGFGQMAKSLYRGGKNLKNIWGKQKPITANYPMSQLTQEAKADYDSKLDVLNNYVNYGTVASSGKCFASNGSPTTCPPGVAAGTTLNSAGTATDMTPEIQTNLQGFARRYGGPLPEAGFGDEIVPDPYTQIIVKNKRGSHADILKQFPGATRNTGTNIQRGVSGNIKTNSGGSRYRGSRVPTTTTYNIPNTITGGRPSFGADNWTPTYYPADIGKYKTGKYGGSLLKAKAGVEPSFYEHATNPKTWENLAIPFKNYKNAVSSIIPQSVKDLYNYSTDPVNLKRAAIPFRDYGRFITGQDEVGEDVNEDTLEYYQYPKNQWGEGGSLPKAQTGFSDWWRERMDNLKDPNLTISGYQKPDRIRQSEISQDEYDTMFNETYTGDDTIEDIGEYKTMYDANIEPRELSPAYDTEYIPGSEDWNQEPGQNRELTPDDPEWDGLFGNSRKKQNNKGKVWDTVGTVAETAVGLAKGANIIGDELEASRQRTHNFNQRMGDYAFEEMPGSQPYQPLGPDTNTGIYGPNRKVISHWGKYGTELPKAQTIGEFEAVLPSPRSLYTNPEAVANDSSTINLPTNFSKFHPVPLPTMGEHGTRPVGIAGEKSLLGVNTFYDEPVSSIKPMNSLVDKLGLTKPGFFGYGNPFWFGEHGMMGGKPLPRDWEGYNVPKLNVETQEWEDQPHYTTFLQELQRTGTEPTGTLTSAGGPGLGLREYFPYSDPIGLGLETDVDPTGPGMGILLNNYRLRQFGNYLADRIGDNSVGNWFQDWNLPPGFTYAGVEMAGNLPMPFIGATVSTHDIPKLQKWAEHPDNQTILDIADYSKHGVGPGLYAWNKGPTIGGRFQLTNPFNPMAKPLWQSPDFFGGRRIHNPISGTGEGIGGRMGIRGGNIIPSVDLGPKSKYINPVNLFTKTKGPLELGFRGGFANIKEEVIAEAQELRKTGKLVDEGKDVIKYSKANKLLSQGDAMKKVYNVKTGAVPTGKLLTKIGVPSAMDKMGEALYGTKGPGAYQKSGNTVPNMIRKSKIPYGKIINNPWVWKNLARGMMIPDALNFASGLTHRPGQPVREFWSPGTNFGLDDPEMQKSSEYGMFPTIQNWWDHRDPVHSLSSTDQTEEDRFKVQENKIYKEEFKKKHGSRPTPPTPVEDKPVFKAAGKQVWYDKDGKIHKVPEGAKIEYPSGLHNYQEPEMNWLQSMLPSHLQPQTIHERAPYAWDASYKDPKTGKYVDLWSYDMPLRKSAEKKAPEAEQKRVEKEKEAWWDWYNSGEQKLKRAMHHSQNISGSPKFKEGGVVNVDEDLLSELIAAGADIEIM